MRYHRVHLSIIVPTAHGEDHGHSRDGFERKRFKNVRITAKFPFGKLPFSHKEEFPLGKEGFPLYEGMVKAPTIYTQEPR